MITLEVLTSGPLATVQDLGRPGLAQVGVTRSGAADRRSHALANRLVANPADLATVEITMGGFTARVHGGSVDLAVTGADCRPALNGVPFGVNSIRHVRPGDVITLVAPAAGVRSYLAVRGGVAVEPVLGSRSHDTLSGIGPPALRSGDLLAIGRPAGDFPRLEQAPVAPIIAGPVTLHAIPGPREDWFTEPDALVGADWAASDRSDRIGLRLVGRPLAHRWPGRQLPSEGMTRGAIQIPPSGQPVILGADHPVTGGYPVIGVLTDADTDVAAQLRPGQTVRLRWARPRLLTRGPRSW